MAATGPQKITISVRVAPPNLEKIDKVAQQKKWTRSQAVDEAIAAFDPDAKPKPNKGKQ